MNFLSYEKSLLRYIDENLYGKHPIVDPGIEWNAKSVCSLYLVHEIFE